jgi:hypothetical protein
MTALCAALLSVVKLTARRVPRPSYHAKPQRTLYASMMPSVRTTASALFPSSESMTAVSTP